MTKSFMTRLALVLIAGGAVVGCSTNPITGRSQLLVVSEAQEAEMGAQAYQEALAQATISVNPAEVEPVRRVGRRIAEAANKPDFKWEFNVVVDDKTMNAWCLPGGKIAFYTGIYPVLADEAGMAFVMGHEVAHALLRHGGERVSQSMVQQGLGAILAATLGGGDEDKQAAVMAAYGVVSNVGVMLPFSRKHESEADALGLELMAKAGYDPRAGVEVWKRMASAGGGGTPEFLSTHPSHETRINDLEQLMPQALAVYQGGANKAAVAKLPAIPGNRKGAPSAEALAAGVAPKSAAARRGAVEDGRKAVSLEFSFDRDVYVQEVHVEGPSGISETIAARKGVPANTRRQVVLTAEKGKGDLPSGKYTLKVTGRADGRAFTSTQAYDVK